MWFEVWLNMLGWPLQKCSLELAAEPLAVGRGSSALQVVQHGYTGGSSFENMLLLLLVCSTGLLFISQSESVIGMVGLGVGRGSELKGWPFGELLAFSLTCLKRSL